MSFLYGRLPLRLKGAVYKSYVRSVVLNGSEAWCLKVALSREDAVCWSMLIVGITLIATRLR